MANIGIFMQKVGILTAKTDILAANSLLLDPTDDDSGVSNFQVSNSYNIPVTNRFQLLEVDQETQVSAANGSNDTSELHRMSGRWEC